MKKIDKIISDLENNVINCEDALEKLAKIGYCPCLFNNDNGYWAVKFSGVQNIPLANKPMDIYTSAFIESKDWKKTIRKALLWALK